MCRAIVFTGTCPACGGFFTWEELSQELSCLEAKNADHFGACGRGVLREEHRFDQECDGCAAEAQADEGVEVGDGEGEEEVWGGDAVFAGGTRKKVAAKGGGGGGGGTAEADKRAGRSERGSLDEGERRTRKKQRVA